MRPVRRRDRQNRDLLKNLFRRKDNAALVDPREDYMTDDLGRPILNLLPEAEVAGTPTQYEEADLAKAGLLALREAGGVVPGLDYALDAAELENISRTGKDFYGDETTPESYATMVGAGMLLPGLVKRPARALGKAFAKVGKRFANMGGSKIDWGAWNPEIPQNKDLLKEYNEIEKRTKRDGTWMKNPDGTDFDGPPELFIQTQSKAFKEAFPEGYDKLYRGVSQHGMDGETVTFFPEPRKGAPTFYSEDAAQASQYSTGYDDYGRLRPGEVDPRRFTPTNMDMEVDRGALFELAYPSEKNKIAINVAGSNWRRTKRFRPEDIEVQEKYIEGLRQDLSNPNKMKRHVQLALDHAETQLRFMKSPRSVSSDKEIDAFYDRYFEWAKNKERINATSPSTDDFADFLKENPDVNRIILRGVDDEWIGDVNILSTDNKVFPKSLIGNRGTFDLSDPNVFKALLPIVGGTAAVRASRGQGEDNSMAAGGVITMRKNKDGMSSITGDPKKKGNDVVERMLASGNWKLGSNGELLRVSAEEANQAALQQSRVAANPAKYSPTTVGFMTPERKTYLEGLGRKLTPEEAREYATVSFDPSENPNLVFGMAAGSTPVEPIGAVVGQGIKSAGKFFQVGKKAAPKAGKKFLEVEDYMYESGPSRGGRTIMEDYDFKFDRAPSSRLRHLADKSRDTAKHSDYYLGDVYDALVEGKVDNPFNTKAQRVVFEKFGLVGDFNKDAAKTVRGVRSNNTARYLNWLSVRHPDIVEDIAKGSEDALYRAMNDKSLADGFMADAETVYRGVTLSPDDPSVREALINPKTGMGERVLGEGVYTTANPNEAFDYATKSDLLYGLNEKGEKIFTGTRVTRRGSVGVLQTDIDYDSPLDLINKLDDTAVSRVARRDRKLPEEVVSSLEVHGGDAHRIYRQGPDGAKLKIKEIIPQSEFDKVDMKFWGTMDFDPNKLDKTYFRGMKESEAFKKAEQQFKNLREPELKKLRRLAVAYDVAGTVARAAEVGIVVSAPTVAILKASSYLFEDDDSNQKASKAQGGVITMRKKRNGMSPIRK
jgi:hypothetical protein